MKLTDQTKDAIAALGAKARTALRRLSGKPAPAPPPAIEGDRPTLMFADPTRVLFPGDPPDDSEISHLPLGSLLEDSAHSMVRRMDILREQAERLVARIADRVEAEVTLITQSMRVLIGLGWLGVAGWLYYATLTARAENMAVLPSGMPVADAMVLSQTFLTIAAAGLGVAFGVAALVNLFGDGDNAKVRREAEEFGLAIADASREFDRDLTALRAEMDKRPNPGDAVTDLSRAHLTALEACAFFRTMPFLTNTEGEEADRQFRRFLTRPAQSPPSLPVFIAGALTGAFLVYYFLVPRPEGEPSAPLAIARYPWAVNLLFFGGLFYAAVGVFLSFFSGALGAGAAAKARAEALDALRGAFTAREAPRPADIIRRIEDAVDVFRARVEGERRSRSNGAVSNHSSGFSAEEDDVPHWRRRDSSARFVETGFQSAPKTWRADAYAKKISSEGDRETGSKRGLPGLKKPSGD